MDDVTARMEQHNLVIKQLKEKEGEFFAYLNALANPEAGKISATAGQLTCTVHGLTVKGDSRPVMRDGNFRMVEYGFTAVGGDPIGYMYLQQTGQLTRDSAGVDVICDATSSYIKHHMLMELSDTLIKSGAFAPAASK